MHKVEAFSIEYQNPHPLPDQAFGLPPWMASRQDVVAQIWP
jgi:hypothetical protein